MTEEDDPFGLDEEMARWQHPGFGRVKPPTDVTKLSKDKFVVLVAPDDDEERFVFEVEGVRLCLGRVRKLHTHLFHFS